MNSPQSKSRLPLLLVPLVLLLAAGALFWLMPASRGPQGNLSNSGVSGTFNLIDETGRAVTSESFDGKWRLMYFGYTFCPDICPTDTATMAAGLRLFEEKHPDAAARLQPLFLTIDPERDTPAALAEFTASFHPRILGLTGSREQVDAALKALRIYAVKVPGATPGSYTMDHQAMFYLLDEQGRPVEFLASSTATPESLAAMLERFLG